MTWDSSWKDITALDGLRRKPILPVHYNDLIAALKERYNNTEDLEVESRDKILLPPYGQSRFNSFDPWDNTSYAYYYDPEMWDEDGELKEDYDPTGYTNEWTFLSGSKQKLLDLMGYSEPLKPTRRSPYRSSDMVFFRDALKYCRNPFCSFTKDRGATYSKTISLEFQSEWTYYEPAGGPADFREQTDVWSNRGGSSVTLFHDHQYRNDYTFIDSYFVSEISQNSWVLSSGLPMSSFSISKYYHHEKTSSIYENAEFYITRVYMDLTMRCCEDDMEFSQTLLNNIVLSLSHRIREWMYSYFSNENSHRWYPNALDGYNILTQRDKNTLTAPWPTPDKNGMDAIAATLDSTLCQTSPIYYPPDPIIIISEGESGSYSEVWNNTFITQLVDNIAFEYV